LAWNSVVSLRGISTDGLKFCCNGCSNFGVMRFEVQRKLCVVHLRDEALALGAEDQTTEFFELKLQIEHSCIELTDALVLYNEVLLMRCNLLMLHKH